ncbi:hypothetical protein PHLGIDRAFT_34176 [Phlebiopsis gigantea 11061_1 CR5-6]|uniref:Yeast cell wall synthesis Kre9/Knh1-like N-terminal domain-containing protein n=1 Tax=Phlebiopsis gigantea (strain 11061_1 CR5-6) TaxID=745531 RepID=A0A0C3NWZ4_PHLG1|nr:hypothetical protein PHLGIDRAFT_34176 [Phlebiopsis gigantea 11061_1 CR5-6]
MFAAFIVALAALPSAFAAISVTSPVATTSWAAGQQQVISWKDDGTAPTLANMGVCMVSIYVGSQTQQASSPFDATQLQLITNNVDVSTTSSVAFTPDASIGPNSGAYFIRFESLNFKDATNSQFNAEAFSAKFTLTGMTGTFNSTVQAQIDAGNSSAGSSASSPAASSPTSASSAITSSAASGSSKAASSTGSAKSTASATGASTSSGAAGVFANAGLVGIVSAGLGAMLL